LLGTLVGLRGNPKACVYTEPMWGLSMALCLPYASVYMLALGLSDLHVGIVASIYMFSQMIFSLLSGVITDKYGRRKVTAIMDFIAYSVPCLIWASAQGFGFFAVAALLNGAMKVSVVSWDCLCIEDADKNKIGHIYTWITICSNLSALFAPIAAVLVSKLTLIPAVRLLYINAFVIMTAKLLLLYKFSRETRTGVIRRNETAGKSWRELIGGYKSVLQMMVTSRGMVFAIIISVVVEISVMIASTFWQIIASRRIGVPDALLPMLPMAKSVMAIVFMFTMMGRMEQSKMKNPLLIGFFFSALSSVILIVIPGTSVVGYMLLISSLALDAFGASMLNVVRETLVGIYANEGERSRVLALLQSMVMCISIPFGYICGALSEASRTYPFVLSIVILGLGAVASVWHFRKSSA
jgi:MFS family permease